jgi:hypothetical protein
MSKKLQNKITKNFDKAFSFEHFTSQSELNAEPVGRDFLNQFVSELLRLNSLSIPLVKHHIESINGVPTPVEYPTYFLQLKQQFQYVQYLTDKLEHLQNKLIDYPEKNEVLVDDVKSLNHCHEKVAQAKFTLGMLVGAHNQEMNNAYFNEAGITKMQAEQLKAFNKYDHTYAKALELTQKVLSHFYSIESNHPFKPGLVIDYIEMLCNENNVDYPKDRKSEIFKDFISAYLKAITPHPNWQGATKDEHKQIDKKAFMKEYKPFIKQVLKR